MHAPALEGAKLEVLVDAVLRATRERLGDAADGQLTQLVVREVVGALVREGRGVEAPHADPLGRGSEQPSRALITSSGRNGKGIVAGIAGVVAEAGGDIQDLSQTIVSDYFTMIMIVDISALSMPFSQLKEALKSTGERLGLHVTVMHEDVMRALQRV